MKTQLAFASRWIAMAILFSGWVGCGAHQSQLAKCQQEKMKLLARISDAEQRAENLAVENRGLDQRLANAEKELALRQDGRDRFAEFKRPANAESPTPSAASSEPPASSLWNTPRFNPPANAPSNENTAEGWRSKSFRKKTE